LKEEEVEKICSLLATTSMTCHEIAQKFQVSDSTIYNIYGKKNWKDIVCKYDFSNRHKVKDSSGKFFIINT
jgi:transposase